ncbi:membrane protein [Streptomyces noursei ATCC 11455]|uniref:hypothetical protein n=1 Tax=Streptomyces noursei TaxID=1971 RepID=UPI00081CC782|nr:membrane protein [Streptomyces noursei ATCC 11455]
MFAAPNTSAIIGSVPPARRGVASGMRPAFHNSGTALSIGLPFSLVIVSPAGALLNALASGPRAQGVPAGAPGLPRTRLRTVPPRAGTAFGTATVMALVAACAPALRGRYRKAGRETGPVDAMRGRKEWRRTPSL